MTVILGIFAATELVIILGLAAENRARAGQVRQEREHGRQTAAELVRVRRQLRDLQRDDGRIVDQLLERGRQEVDRLEAHYRRHLPERGRRSA